MIVPDGTVLGHEFVGEIVVAGFCTKPETLVPAAAVVKELAVIFSIGESKADFQFVVDMLAAARIQPDRMITRVVGFDDLPGAIEALKTSTDQCKVILDPGA